MEITLKTKIYDLISRYPFMEDKLIEINPKFKKLKNPVLKRTVAKIASIKQAAKVGGMDPVELLNLIRAEVGQPPVTLSIDDEPEDMEVPKWVREVPKAEFDGNELLDSGKNPLGEITEKLKELPAGSVVLLRTDFKPEPLIEEMRKRGFSVYSDRGSDEEYLTYIKKES